MGLLDLAGIERVFGEAETATVALRGISFSVAKGEFVAIMGRSGSGKSTLLHILGLLDRPSAGTYRLDGQETAELSDEALARIRNNMFGFIFQVFHLLPRATVLENVMLPLFYSAVPRSRHAALAQAALERVELTHRLAHRPPQLSGGERQRVAIARALVNDPHVVFADEPTGNLDSKTGALVMRMIDTLHAEGRTVVLITHETPTASYAQRIITLHDGRVTGDALVTDRHRHFTK